jgi:hypothetical protein
LSFEWVTIEFSFTRRRRTKLNSSQSETIRIREQSTFIMSEEFRNHKIDVEALWRIKRTIYKQLLVEITRVFSLFREKKSSNFLHDCENEFESLNLIALLFSLSFSLSLSLSLFFHLLGFVNLFSWTYFLQQKR